MRKLILLFFLGMSIAAPAQNVQPYDLIPYRKDSLWGYADIARTVLIRPQYDEVHFFNDEITAVRMGSKWGFINKFGKMITAFKYDLAGDFKEGMCQVRIDDRVGYVNVKGKEVVRPMYDYGYPFSEGLAVVSNEEGGRLVSKVIDKTGRELLSGLDALSGAFHSGCLPVLQDGAQAFIDKGGKKLRLPEQVFPYFEFSNDAAIVKLQSMEKNGLQTDTLYYLGIIGTNGKLRSDTIKDVFGFKVSVKGQEKVISNFVNGFAILQRPLAAARFAAYDKGLEYAFIDQKGKMSMWFSSVRAFSAEGLSLVMAPGDSLVRIVDTGFKTLTTTIPISDAGTFSENRLRFQLPDTGKWGYMNERGEVVLYPVYDSCTDFSGGVATVVLNGRKGYINKNGLQFWDQ